MSTFTVSDWKAAFKTQLENRPNLAGVTVYDAEEAMPDTDREAIVLGDWESQNRRLTYTVDQETYTVTGHIRIWKPDTAAAARDRAIAVLTEVKDTLTDDPDTGVVFDTLFAGYTAEERLWADQGRVCTIEFTIDVEAHQ